MSGSAGRGSAGQEWTGPWADDAQRLFTVLRDVADRAASTAGEAAAGTAGSEHAHATATECSYCPICSGMAMIRRSGPELLDKVADLAAGLAATWRAADRDRPAPWETSVPDDAASPARESSPAHAAFPDEPGDPEIPPIQRIIITD